MADSNLDALLIFVCMESAEANSSEFRLRPNRRRKVLPHPVLPRLEDVQFAGFQPTILEHGIFWAWHLYRKIIRPGYLETDLCAREGENLSGEIVPRTASFRRGVVQPIRMRATESYNLSAKLGGRSRSDEFAVHDANLATLSCQLQHEFDKVQPSLGSARLSPINSRCSQDKMLLQRGPYKMFTAEFCVAIHVQRVGNVRVLVRASFYAIKYIVGTHVHEGCTNIACDQG